MARSRRIPLELIGEAYSDASLPFSAQDSVNCFPITAEVNGTREVTALIGCSGLRSFGTVGTGGSRGVVKMNGVAYEVRDTGFYSVAADGVGTLLGTIEGAGRVGICTNGTQVIIVNGSHSTGKGYYYTVAGGLLEITDPDFPRADDCFFAANYIWFINKTTDQASISALGDGSSIDALDIVTANDSPDGLVGGIELNGDVLLMGEETIEPWRHTGAADFPFERITSIRRGLAATFAKQVLDGALYWLGENGVVYVLDGYTPRRISKRPQERELARQTLSEAFALAYEPEGRSFFALTLGLTWEYDVGENMWHRRESFGMDRWRVNTYLNCYGKHLFGDMAAGTLWELSPDVYTEGDQLLVWERKTQYVHDNGEFVKMAALVLLWESGTALATGQGSDPQCDMAYSDNGGRSYVDFRSEDMGAVGEYEYEVVFNGLGRFRQRNFWIRCSEPIKRNLIGAQGIEAT